MWAKIAKTNSAKIVVGGGWEGGGEFCQILINVEVGISVWGGGGGILSKVN